MPLEEAQAHVLASCPPLEPVRLALREALGAVTAEAVHAAEDVPPFANTAVDGFAVQASSVREAPVELEIVGLVRAGDAGDVPVGRGQAVRIMTGAPIPPGADAVVMVEDTEAVGGRVRIRRSATAGDAVREVGSDVRRGDEVVPKGTELRPAHLGVLASVGIAEVLAFPRARVGVLSTGDELREAGQPLSPGQIRESNKPMLLALVERAGALPVDLGLVPDDEEALTGAIEAAVASCDAVLTSGGVSMGDFDLVKVVLSRMGDMRWMQIAIRPAKPFAFGLLGDDRRVPVFGLPGNPVSSMVSFELLARPALRQMMGHRDPYRPTVVAVADEGLARRSDGKTHFVRVHARFGTDGRVHVTSTGPQGSHQLAASAAANALAVLPDGNGVPAGGDVEARLFGE